MLVVSASLQLLYALLLASISAPPGAAACVTLAAAILIGVVALGLLPQGRGRQEDGPPPGPVDRLAGVLRDKPAICRGGVGGGWAAGLAQPGADLPAPSPVRPQAAARQTPSLTRADHPSSSAQVPEPQGGTRPCSSCPIFPMRGDALSPVLSDVQMRTHHDKHHAKYVETLNGMLPDISPRAAEPRGSGQAGGQRLQQDAVQQRRPGLEPRLLLGVHDASGGPSVRPTSPRRSTKPSAAWISSRPSFVEEGVGHFASG